MALNIFLLLLLTHFLCDLKISKTIYIVILQLKLLCFVFELVGSVYQVWHFLIQKNNFQNNSSLRSMRYFGASPRNSIPMDKKDHHIRKKLKAFFPLKSMNADYKVFISINICLHEPTDMNLMSKQLLVLSS